MRPETFNEITGLISLIGLERARQACLKLKGWQVIDRPKYQETRPIFDDRPIRKILSDYGLVSTRERIIAFAILACVK
jgi:hypothetical protein